jgi:hypothetical protein
VQSRPNLFHELRIGWRMALPTFLAQLAGGGLLLAIGWPTSIPSMPDVPIWAMRLWVGAALSIPIGVALGFVLQRLSGRPGSRHLMINGLVCAVLLPLFALVIVNV